MPYPGSFVTFMTTKSPAPQLPHKPMERPTLSRKPHFLWSYHVQTFKSPLTHKFASSYTLWHMVRGPEFPGEAEAAPGTQVQGTRLSTPDTRALTWACTIGAAWGTELGDRAGATMGDPGPVTHRVFSLGGHSQPVTQEVVKFELWLLPAVPGKTLARSTTF